MAKPWSDESEAKPATSRRTILAGAAVAAAGAGVAGWAGGAPAQAGTDKATARRSGRPNVIVISIDDLGWDEFGCYGNTFNETPEIDRLAAEGTRFAQAYAAAPLCSPTRAALVTGQYPGRTGITDYLRPEAAASNNFLSPELRSLPRELARRGYTCGLIGKWHLTETYSGPYEQRPGNPFAHGFDEVLVSEQRYIANGDYFHPYFFMPELPARRPDEYLTDRLADEATAYVERHRKQPFFLHVSNYGVHTTLAAKADLVAKYQQKPDADVVPNRPLLAAMLESIDHQVGRIRRSLEHHRIADDTVLLITSDNGGQSRPANAPLRGGKGELYEGGIRVPLVAWGGRRLVGSGRSDDTVTSTIDLLPTALDLAGGSRPRGVDGISIASALRGLGRPVRRDAMFWVYPHHIGQTRPQAAVRQGRHKVVLHLREQRAELYDLAADPGETHDIGAQQPRVRERLRRLLEDHLDELDLYPGAPSSSAPEFAETFDADPVGWETASVGAQVATASVAAGQWLVSTSRHAHVLALASETPRTGRFSMVLDPGRFRNDGREETVFVGLAQDADNYLLLRYRHDKRRVGWDLRQQGRLITEGAEPTTNWDGTVDLDHDAARYGLSVRGSQLSAWADQGTGAGWEFLFRFDVGGVLDLADPVVRAGYRFAVGARLDRGALGIDGVSVHKVARS